jgi:hypothetical protein
MSSKPPPELRARLTGKQVSQTTAATSFAGAFHELVGTRLFSKKLAVATIVLQLTTMTTELGKSMLAGWPGGEAFSALDGVPVLHIAYVSFLAVTVSLTVTYLGLVKTILILRCLQERRRIFRYSVAPAVLRAFRRAG